MADSIIKFSNPYISIKAFAYDDPSGVLKNWVNLEEVEVGFAPVPWVMNLLPLKRIDTEPKHVEKHLHNHRDYQLYNED